MAVENSASETGTETGETSTSEATAESETEAETTGTEESTEAEATEEGTEDEETEIMLMAASLEDEVDLASPELVKATSTNAAITITWEAVENAAGYKVYRKVSEEEEWTVIAGNSEDTVIDGTATSYTDEDSSLVRGTTYYYAVTAYTYDEEEKLIESEIDEEKCRSVVFGITGWVIENGNTYYYVKGEATVGEKYINGYWYYFDANGVMATGFQTITTSSGVTKKVYYNSNGQMQYGEKCVNGYWYYFNTSTGEMATGFQTITTSSGVTKKVYYNSHGQMQYGEKYISGYWYYFDTSTGKMATDFQTITTLSGVTKKVYYNSNGQMQYGEQYI
ncbi:MAG: hypothetical protein LUH07_03320, partial [Lachnospiraceae bacterium]|nr:hypothetical protein [Lachnospiraceae bacterium]